MKNTIQKRREIIEAAAGAALARTRGDEQGAQAYVDEAGELFRRQPNEQSAARHLFNETYRNEWVSLHAVA